MYSTNDARLNLATIRKYTKKIDTIIIRLKKTVEKKGYYENLGIKEMRIFDDFLGKEERLKKINDHERCYLKKYFWDKTECI